MYNELPPDSDVQTAAKLSLIAEDGSKTTFGDVVRGRKTIVIFIRHFFCGMCQAYVGQLAEKTAELDHVGAAMVVIGCGEYNLIPNYRKNTGFTGTILADPQRHLYRQLGMTVETLKQTPAGEERKSYAAGSRTMNAFMSILRIRNPLHIGRQGNISQLGGEFIFEPDLVCTFAHRMAHTEDHVECKVLMAKAGLPEDN